MIVESLALRNWRSYRGLHHFDFCDGLNLLIGPNEAGKSTLFEALVRAFFDRHTSRARELRSVRPLGSSLGPEVEVVFSVGDIRYSIAKRFLTDPKSELRRERDGVFELDHEGDRADQALRELLGGEQNRGISKPEHRGLAQALWYLQRESALPERAWSEALRQGLTGLVELVLRSPEEERLRKRIEAEYSNHFTASGRLSKKSERAQLEEALPRMELELERRRGELDRVARFRAELSELEQQTRELSGRASSLAELQKELLEACDAARDLEKEKIEKDAQLVSIKNEHLNHKKAFHSFRTRLERISRSQKAVLKLHQRRAQLDAEVRQHRRSAERHARRWEKELEPRLQAVDRRLEELQSRQKLEQLEREADLLESIVRRSRELDERHRTLKADIKASRVPLRERLNDLRRFHAELQKVEAQIEVGAVRVGFELGEADRPVQDAAPQVEPESRYDEETSEYLVTQETVFTLPSGTRVRVRGGSDLMLELHQTRDRLAGELAEAYRSFDVGSHEGLERRVRKVRELETELSDVRKQRAEVDREYRQPQARLEELAGQISTLRGRAPQAVLPGIEGWALERTQEQLEELELERTEIKRLMRKQREAEQRAQSECLKCNGELLEVGSQISKIESQVEALDEENRIEIEPYGSLELLEERCSVTGAQLEELEARHRQWQDLYEEKVLAPRRALETSRAQLAAIEGEERRLGSEMTDRLARIEEVAALGIHGELVELEAELERRKRRLEVVELRSEAAALLQHAFETARRQRSVALAGPITEVVDRWLSRLTEHRYQGLSLDESLLPTGLASRKYETTLPLESLSYGTHEQVGVLLRLAMGVLLSHDERQMVVLDDRLVNADPKRMRHLVTILEEAAGSCQILLATCHPESYESLASARRLRVPSAAVAIDSDRAKGSESTGAAEQPVATARLDRESPEN